MQHEHSILATACIVSRGSPRNTTWEVMKADVVPRAIPTWIRLCTKATSSSTNIFLY